MFEWDEANEEHIARHGVHPWEVEEAMEDRRRIRITAHSGRLGIVGRTEDGRLLAVIFEDSGSRVRVVTARDPNATELRAYRRANR
jgi:uncharacterized DUF497 family protein